MATLTITTTPAQDARIVEAFGSQLGLGRNATMAEIKGDIIEYVKYVVLRYEGQKAAAEAQQGVTPVTLT